MENIKKTAIYAGTFDPCTRGHMDIVKRAAKLYGNVVVAISNHSKKSVMFDAEKRAEAFRAAIEGLPNVTVDIFDNLLVDCAAKHDANVIIRGLRVSSDFEYEFQMAQFAKDQNPDIEMIYLMATGNNLHISSSSVRELMSLNADVTNYVPQAVLNVLKGA
jgi:pantetheine-phosphate adenylyltransferase